MKWCVAVNQAEVEETLKRIQGQKGVQGIIIVNAEGEDRTEMYRIVNIEHGVDVVSGFGVRFPLWVQNAWMHLPLKRPLKCDVHYIDGIWQTLLSNSYACTLIYIIYHLWY